MGVLLFTKNMTPIQKRAEIKRLLAMLSDNNHSTFKRMYSHTNLNRDINDVVDGMPTKQLSWALQQVQNSYYKLFKMLAEK